MRCRDVSKHARRLDGYSAANYVRFSQGKPIVAAFTTAASSDGGQSC
jgi:hypothetical protein